MSDPKNPAVGDQQIDLSDLTLVDITPDHKARLTKLREGHAETMDGFVQIDAAACKRAGLGAEEVADVVALWEKCKRIDAVLPAVEKLCELLVETRLVEGHNLAIRIGEMAHQIRRRASRTANGTEVMAPFEKLLDYHFAVGQQAAATREKKKKAQAEAEPGGTELPIPQKPL